MWMQMFVSSRKRATVTVHPAPGAVYRFGHPGTHRPADWREFRMPAPTPSPSRATRSRLLYEKFPPRWCEAEIPSAAGRLDCCLNERPERWPYRLLLPVYTPMYISVG